MGANIALIYAAEHKFVPAVLLLSPGWDYAGLGIDSAIKNYGERPIAIAASPGDKYACESSVYMVDIARDCKSKVEFFPGDKSKHGVQMFDGKFENKIIEWIEEISLPKSPE